MNDTAEIIIGLASKVIRGESQPSLELILAMTLCIKEQQHTLQTLKKAKNAGLPYPSSFRHSKTQSEKAIEAAERYRGEV